MNFCHSLNESDCSFALLSLNSCQFLLRSLTSGSGSNGKTETTKRFGTLSLKHREEVCSTGTEGLK